MIRLATASDSLNDRMSSVLLVSPWYRPAIGGVVEVADTLLRTLNTAGTYTTLLVCADGASRFSLIQDPLNASVWRYDMPPMAGLAVGLARRVSGVVSRGLTLLLLARFILRFGIKTVILIYPIDYAWPFPILAKVIPFKIVLSFHGSDVLLFHEYPTRLQNLMRKLLSCADAITVPTDSLKTAVQKVADNRSPTVTTIKNSVDVTRFVPRPKNYIKKHEGFRVVHVSNFAKVKRTLDIVHAFARAMLPDTCRLVMVGEGPDRRAAEEAALQANIMPRVDFTGAVQDIRHILWDADLFVMASDEETGPLAILEAMACGVPWVSTRCGLLIDWSDGAFGFLVPHRSIQSLAHAMEELLLKDVARRLEMGVHARAWVEKEHSNERYVSEHLRLIKSLQH